MIISLSTCQRIATYNETMNKNDNRRNNATIYEIIHIM